MPTSKYKFLIVLILSGLILGSFLFTAVGAEEERYGSTLRVALSGTPPSLDQQVITSDMATMLAQHFFEGLYTFNAEYDPVPLLAKSSEVSNNGQQIDIQLREGVMFHNGKELTSEDVVASLKRWGEYGVRGPVLFEHVEEVVSLGDYEVRMTLTEPFAPWKSLLAFINGGPVIYPAEVASEAGEEPIDTEDYIGTGPYKFVEHVSGRHYLVERFEDYSNLPGEPDGYAGNRKAYFDEIRFVPVDEPGTRVSGIKGNDYDYAINMPGDLYNQLDRDKQVRTLVNQGPKFGELFFNSRKGIMTNQKLRQAAQAAFDLEPSMRAAHGAEALWDLNGSIMPPNTVWYTEAGTENYNQGDIEKAQRLMEEAGYDGEPIRLMTTTSYMEMYNHCIVLATQLRKAGFNVDLQVYDWATVTSRRTDPDAWDLFFTWHGFVPDPVLYTFMSPTYPGWWDTPEKEELVAELTRTVDPEERQEIWSQLQELLYEQVPIVKQGDAYTYNIASPDIEGLEDTSLIWPKFWGIWK
ncbi:ABC transporter substrate-binding protein [Candidatus Bipolaricaulota bacterium]|nr:ABC transporter substrate-binding protein [Candidatus Bipolaricaulota bacterium]